MKTESLLEKLDRRLPGAFLNYVHGAPPEQRWQVLEKDGAELRVRGFGASQREAIDRAVFLFGVQR